MTNSDNILNMMKAQEEATTKAMKNLDDGLKHVQKKVRYYTMVNEAVKNNTPLPSWDDV